MLDTQYTLRLLLNPFGVLGLLAITVICFISWYQWRFARAYKHFPSQRLYSKWLLTFIKWPAMDIPVKCALFRMVREVANAFQAEGLCVMWFFKPFLLIYSDEFSKVLLNNLVDKPAEYGYAKEFFGNGLITSNGEMWMSHRKLLNPAFYLGVLRGNLAIFNENALSLVEGLKSWEGQPRDDLLDIVKNCSFYIMSESVLGLNLKQEKYGSKVRKLMKHLDIGQVFVVERFARPWLRWDVLLPFFSSGRNYMEGVKGMHSFAQEIVEDLKKSASSSGNQELNLDGDEVVRKSFAQILIKQHLQDPSFTTNDVRDHLINIMAAGYDTVSVTMMWCFYLLGHHPQKQEKAFQEVNSVVPEGDVTYENLLELNYLDSIIKETLRLYPTVPFYGRNVDKDTKIGKYTIPEGTNVAISPFLMHRNPYIYPHPEKFQPERFSDPSIRSSAHIPFAEGYRSCIGKKFAMMEMKILLAHIIRRFEIQTLDTVDDTELCWEIVLTPLKPFRLLFTSRQSQS